MIDCLIIGQNDPDLGHHLRTIKLTFGSASGAYQDQDLTFITHKGKPYRLMDLLNLINEDQLERPLSNMDFLWPTIAVLGSFLTKHGMSFDYVNQYRAERDLLRAKLSTNAYRVVAISTTLYVTDTPIREIVGFVREHAPAALVVVGGPYIQNRMADNTNAQLDREFAAMGADLYVNSSEGQLTLVRAIECLRAGRPLDGVDNLIWHKRLRAAAALRRASSDEQQHYVFNPTSVEDNPLEDNPVDLTLFRREDLTRFFSVSTAKSCPFRCSFCSFPTRAGKYRYVDVELVEDYLNRLHGMGVDTISFLDDTFNVPQARFKAILRMMIKNRYGFKWNSFYRSDHGDAETIELMAESGCEGVFLGIESASDRMLENMNKTSRRKHYAAAIPLLKQHGIHTHANFIIGFPGETPETVKETLDFVKEYRPDTYKAQLWYLDTNSPVWKKRHELDIKGIGFNWSHETMDANEATRWVDHFYAEVTDSAYLPEDGFGLWSVFYLQRLGMDHAQVLAFLRAFARAVVVKRTDPSQQEIPEAMVQQLFELGRIDGRGAAPDRLAGAVARLAV